MYINYRNGSYTSKACSNMELRNHHIIQHILDFNNIDHPYELIIKLINTKKNDPFAHALLKRGSLSATAKRFGVAPSRINQILCRFLRQWTKTYYTDLGRD